MFCSGCGQSCIPNAKFCHHCGKNVQNINENATSSSSSGCTSGADTPTGSTTGSRRLPSFSSFRARKEQDRSKFFKHGTVKKAKTEEKPTEVKINVGIMVLKDGKLSIKRGATLPLTVPTSMTSEQLLKKAVEKHGRFNSNLVKDLTSFRLLYPGNEEVINLPGTEERFSLQRYKEEIDKPYSRITFFLCSFDDFIEHLTFSDHSDDDIMLSRPCFAESKPAASSGEHIQLSSSSTSSKPAPQGANAIIVEDFATGPSTYSQADKQEGATVQCPLCMDHYPLSEIEAHADTCSLWMLEDDDEPLFDLDTKQDSTISNRVANDEIGVVSKEILKERISHVASTEMCTEDEPKRVTVRRKFLWNDFKNARSKSITPKTRIKVVFSGEPAVDDGGPKRELFSELLAVIKRKFLTNGKPIQSTLALSSGDFKLCGEVMGMSVLQGGPAPNFLSTEIVSYLTGVALSPSNNDSTNYRLLGESLANASSDSEVTSTLTIDSNLDILGLIGYTGIPQRETVQSAKAIIQSLCVKDQIGEYLPQVMQIESGLAECGLMKYLKTAPEIWRTLFESGNMFKLSAGEILDQVNVDFSMSQLAKEKEIDTYKFFCDVLEVIDAGEIEDLHLSDFLKWLTGSQELPPLGFSKPISVQFVHDCLQDCNCRPTVSTCDTTVKIPVHINSEQIMRDMLHSAIKDSYGFGNL